MTSASCVPSRLLSTLCGLVLVAASAAVAHAAPPKREATLGGGTGSGPIMSMADLRACVKREKALKTRSDEAVKAQTEMTNERTTLEQGSEAIKTDMANLDRSNLEAVEAFVERAKAHDKRIDDYQARVPAFNEQVQALAAEREAYAKACEGRRYLEDDYKDIKAGK
jgi:hypothetical protein